MIQTKTTSSNQAWANHLRVRVGQTVSHNDGLYINKTGRNTEPGVGFDYDFVGLLNKKDSKPIVIVNGNPFYLTKNPNNNTPENRALVEQNDVINDGFWAADEYWKVARFIGVDVNDKADWQVLDAIEEIPIN